MPQWAKPATFRVAVIRLGESSGDSSGNLPGGVQEHSFTGPTIACQKYFSAQPLFASLSAPPATITGPLEALPKSR
jgi:hypothetical protein